MEITIVRIVQVQVEVAVGVGVEEFTMESHVLSMIMVIVFVGVTNVIQIILDRITMVD
jgi:hypothetical protein